MFKGKMLAIASTLFILSFAHAQEFSTPQDHYLFYGQNFNVVQRLRTETRARSNQLSEAEKAPVQINLYSVDQQVIGDQLYLSKFVTESDRNRILRADGKFLIPVLDSDQAMNALFRVRFGPPKLQTTGRKILSRSTYFIEPIEGFGGYFVKFVPHIPGMDQKLKREVLVNDFIKTQLPHLPENMRNLMLESYAALNCSFLGVPFALAFRSADRILNHEAGTRVYPGHGLLGCEKCVQDYALKKTGITDPKKAVARWKKNEYLPKLAKYLAYAHHVLGVSFEAHTQNFAVEIDHLTGEIKHFFFLDFADVLLNPLPLLGKNNFPEEIEWIHTKLISIHANYFSDPSTEIAKDIWHHFSIYSGQAVTSHVEGFQTQQKNLLSFLKAYISETEQILGQSIPLSADALKVIESLESKSKRAEFYSGELQNRSPLRNAMASIAKSIFEFAHNESIHKIQEEIASSTSESEHTNLEKSFLKAVALQRVIFMGPNEKTQVLGKNNEAGWLRSTFQAFTGFGFGQKINSSQIELRVYQNRIWAVDKESKRPLATLLDNYEKSVQVVMEPIVVPVEEAPPKPNPPTEVTDLKSFGQAMTEGMLLWPKQGDLFEVYQKVFFGNPDVCVNNENLKSVNDVLNAYPGLTKTVFSEYLIDAVEKVYETPESLAKYIKSKSATSGQLRSNLFQVEANLGFWKKLLNNKDPRFLDRVISKENRALLKNDKIDYKLKIETLYRVLDFVAKHFDKRGVNSQFIRQTMVDLVASAGFNNQATQILLKSKNALEKIEGLKKINDERDTIAMELGFEGHFIQLLESLKIKSPSFSSDPPSELKIIESLEKDVLQGPFKSKPTETVRMRALSIQEAGFRSRLGGSDCSSRTYFSKALDPNFNYFTLTDSEHHSSGHATIVLGTAKDENGTERKVAFLDKLQNIPNQKIPYFLESIRLTLLEHDYLLVLPENVGDHNGLSNMDTIRHFVANDILKPLTKTLTGFIPHPNDYPFPNRYSRAYSLMNVRVFEFNHSNKDVEVRKGSIFKSYAAGEDLNKEKLIRNFLILSESKDEAEVQKFISSGSLIDELAKLGLYSHEQYLEQLVQIGNNQEFTFSTRKQAFFQRLLGIEHVNDGNFSTYFTAIGFNQNELEQIASEFETWWTSNNDRKLKAAESLKARFMNFMVLHMNHPDQSEKIKTQSSPIFEAFIQVIRWGDLMLGDVIEAKNHRIIKILLKNKFIDINETSSRGSNLGIAIRTGDIEIVKLILKHKNIDVNLADKQEGTALLYNAFLPSYKPEVVRLLLERKELNINAKNRAGFTVLHLIAAYTDDIELLQVLLKRKDIDVNAKCKAGASPLIAAIFASNTKAVELLLQDPNVNVNLKDNTTNTPLMYALSKRNSFDPEVIKLLLGRKDIDVNAKNEAGTTALMYALGFENIEVFKMLLNRNDIDVNIKNSDGNNLLIQSVEANRLEHLKLLLQRPDIDVNSANSYGETALITALKHKKNPEIVKLLLQRPGVDLNAKDNSKISTLSWAVLSDNIEAVRYLLKQKNIDVNVKDHNGFTALWHATTRTDNSPKIARVLLEHPEIDVNVQGNRGEYILEQLQYAGRPEVEDLLLQHKNIDVNVKNSRGVPILFEVSGSLLDKLIRHPKINLEVVDKDHGTFFEFFNGWGQHKVQNYFEIRKYLYHKLVTSKIPPPKENGFASDPLMAGLTISTALQSLSAKLNISGFDAMSAMYGIMHLWQHLPSKDQMNAVLEFAKLAGKYSGGKAFDLSKVAGRTLADRLPDATITTSAQYGNFLTALFIASFFQTLDKSVNNDKLSLDEFTHWLTSLPIESLRYATFSAGAGAASGILKLTHVLEVKSMITPEIQGSIKEFGIGFVRGQVVMAAGMLVNKLIFGYEGKLLDSLYFELKNFIKADLTVEATRIVARGLVSKKLILNVARSPGIKGFMTTAVFLGAKIFLSGKFAEWEMTADLSKNTSESFSILQKYLASPDEKSFKNKIGTKEIPCLKTSNWNSLPFCLSNDLVQNLQTYIFATKLRSIQLSFSNYLTHELTLEKVYGSILASEGLDDIRIYRTGFNSVPELIKNTEKYLNDLTRMTESFQKSVSNDLKLALAISKANDEKFPANNNLSLKCTEQQWLEDSYRCIEIEGALQFSLLQHQILNVKKLGLLYENGVAGRVSETADVLAYTHYEASGGNVGGYVMEQYTANQFLQGWMLQASELCNKSQTLFCYSVSKNIFNFVQNWYEIFKTDPKEFMQALEASSLPNKIKQTKWFLGAKINGPEAYGNPPSAIQMNSLLIKSPGVLVLNRYDQICSPDSIESLTSATQDIFKQNLPANSKLAVQEFWKSKLYCDVKPSSIRFATLAEFEASEQNKFATYEKAKILIPVIKMIFNQNAVLPNHAKTESVLSLSNSEYERLRQIAH